MAICGAKFKKKNGLSKTIAQLFLLACNKEGNIASNG